MGRSCGARFSPAALAAGHPHIPRGLTDPGLALFSSQSNLNVIGVTCTEKGDVARAWPELYAAWLRDPVHIVPLRVPQGVGGIRRAWENAPRA